MTAIHSAITRQSQICTKVSSLSELYQLQLPLFAHWELLVTTALQLTLN
jgi:hypothetical protein